MVSSLPGYDQRPAEGGFAPPRLAAETEGVLSRRLFAWLLDIVFIFLFTCLLATAILILGLLTLSLGWALFAILPASGVIYSAITVGGRKQSTLGMRMMGLRAANATSGAPVDWITAAVHALLFYLAAATFLVWLLDVFVGLVRPDRRMGHDVLVGIVVVRAS